MDVSKLTNTLKPTGGRFDGDKFTLSLDITVDVPDHMGTSIEGFTDELADALQDGKIDGAEKSRLAQRGLSLALTAAIDPGKPAGS